MLELKPSLLGYIKITVSQSYRQQQDHKGRAKQFERASHVLAVILLFYQKMPFYLLCRHSHNISSLYLERISN